MADGTVRSGMGDGGLRFRRLVLALRETGGGRRGWERSSMHAQKHTRVGQFAQVTSNSIF